MQPEDPLLLRPATVQSRLGRLEEWAAMGLVAALAAVVNLQIAARYLFESPFIWPEEVSRLLLVWLSFIASG